MLGPKHNQSVRDAIHTPVEVPIFAHNGRTVQLPIVPLHTQLRRTFRPSRRRRAASPASIEAEHRQADRPASAACSGRDLPRGSQR